MSNTHKEAITNFVNDLRERAIADLSKQTSFTMEESFVQERMIDAWIEGRYAGHLEGYTSAMDKAITILKSNP